MKISGPDVIKPPSRILPEGYKHRVFLAGAIDMGNAEHWQEAVIQSVGDNPLIAFFNPRRDDWDASWVQKLDNPQFNEQVNWELDMMKEADTVFIYFPNESKAPISLLEFGLMVVGAPHKLVVVCGPEFYRRGNLEVLCNRARIAMHDSLRDGLIELNNRVMTS